MPGDETSIECSREREWGRGLVGAAGDGRHVIQPSRTSFYGLWQLHIQLENRSGLCRQFADGRW